MLLVYIEKWLLTSDSDPYFLFLIAMMLWRYILYMGSSGTVKGSRKTVYVELCGTEVGSYDRF